MAEKGLEILAQIYMRAVQVESDTFCEKNLAVQMIRN